MAATVQIDEENTSSHTVSSNITNSNFGSIDAANLNSTANPVAQSSSSFSKWQEYEVTAMGGSTAVQNLRCYATAPGSGWTMFTNMNVTQGTYTTNVALHASPPTPSASDLSGTTMPTSMPTSQPGTANLGIAGVLATTSQLTAAGFSDWLGMQLKCATPTAGGSLTITYGYDEVA
jgi:hypothetical protein